MKHIFKFFVAALLLLVSHTQLFAQAMSDDQVMSYIVEQNEKGKSQQEIATELVKKGVTTDQIQRVRKKYAESKTPQSTGTSTGIDRTRDDNTASENEALEYIVETSENEVFGRNIFNNKLLTFQPNMNMATPSNYRLGAGDQVFIDVWGASQETFKGVISPDGTITISGVGPVELGGKTVSQANSYLKGKLGKFYESSNIKLTVGETRTIQVQVMGEVFAPGTYTLSSLSSSFNALYAAGGISKIGTLRDIKVYRSGKVIASIDVYDYILNGNISGDVRLQDNDIIIVGPYDSLVKISGKVKRPMFYEMRHDESVKTLLDYAGGFTGDAYKKNVRLVRKTGAEYSIHTIDEFEMGTFKLNDGDAVSVDEILNRFSNKVEIKGAVMHPGSFQMDGRIATVRELINAAEGLREDAFTNRAVMHRTKDDLTLEVIPVDVLGILEGRVADIPLKKEDVLFVPSKLDMLGEQTVSIVGEINAPGTYPYADNTTLEDLVLQAGGLTSAASTMKVDVYRRIINSKSSEVSDSIAETYSFALKDGFVIDGEAGFVLKPFDEVAVRRSPVYEKQQMVSIGGEVNFDGYYSLKTRNYRVSELVKDAGGLSKMAYVKGSRLERRMTEGERLQREIMLRASQIALYEENLASDKAIDMRRADSLLMMKLDMGNTYPVAIDLAAALENPGGEDDVILREGDRLVVPQYTNAIKISGNVMQPVSMTYVKGKSLSYYIKRAGGYGDNARKSKVYAIYMNGAVKEVESSKDIQPGCEIVVPSKKQKRQMSTAEMMSVGTSAASIATMIITVANILK